MSSKPIIDRSNYESYFLDFLEGRLDASMHYQLRLFLLHNPDLADQLDGIQQMKLAPDTSLPPSSKGRLKRELVPFKDYDDSTIDNKLVSWLEGEMGPEETADLHHFIELNPAFRFDLELYQKTILEPEAEVVFPDKQSLRRSLFLAGRGRLFWLVATAAAMLILLIGWRVFFNVSNPPPEVPGLSWLDPAVEGQPVLMPAEITPMKAGPVMIQAEKKEIAPRELAQTTIERHSVLYLDPVSVAELQTIQDQQPVYLAHPAAGLLANDESPNVDQKNGIFLGKLLYKISSKNRDRREDTQLASMKDNKVNFWSIAGLGVKGYNKLADRNIEMEVVRDGTGEPKEYSFTESGRVLLSRPANQQ